MSVWSGCSALKLSRRGPHALNTGPYPTVLLESRTLSFNRTNRFSNTPSVRKCRRLVVMPAPQPSTPVRFFAFIYTNELRQSPTIPSCDRIISDLSHSIRRNENPAHLMTYRIIFSERTVHSMLSLLIAVGSSLQRTYFYFVVAIVTFVTR